jgi:hypothetical protein
MHRFFRNNGKKILAVLGAVLMITFFMPSMRGSGSRATMGDRVTATIYNNQKITVYESEMAKREWDELRHLTFLREPNDEQPLPLTAYLREPALLAINANPNSFLLLIEEARDLGIGVSNDQYQDMIKSHIGNFPDDSDPDFDEASHAVYDVLLVRNLLDRVGDTVKWSQPRAVRTLALTQQELSVNVVEFSADNYRLAATPPTPQEIQSQYDRYSQTLAGSFDASNPLGFGYLLPDRVMAQYFGFTLAELRQDVKASRPMIEWQTQARRLYRTHTADFPVTTIGPSTQPSSGTVAWEDLPTDVVNKVYDRVYNAAASDLAHKVLDRLTTILSADWVAYHDATAKGDPVPVTALGVPYNSDEYVRLLGDSMEREFGIRMVLGIASNGWKTAGDLSLLDGIGQAHTTGNQPFGEYATTAGDRFVPSAKLTAGQRLSLWQPSQPLVSGDASSTNGVFVFRPSGMDPSHTWPLSEAHDQAIADILTQRAWGAAVADADQLLGAARQTGLLDAAKAHIPPLAMTTTDYFNPARATDRISGLTLRAPSVRAFAQGAMKLLSQSAPGRPSVAEVDLGADREVAVVELNKARADWTDAADRQMREAALADREVSIQTQDLEYEWSLFDNVAKRTQYKEAPKQ